MTTKSDHRPVVNSIRIRIPAGSHAIGLRYHRNGGVQVALRPTDGWRIAILLQNAESCYEVTLERGTSEPLTSPVKGFLPLHGAAGSIRHWWNEEKLDVQVRRDGEWVTVEDDAMWEIAFGPIKT